MGDVKVLHFIPSLKSAAGPGLSDYKVPLLTCMAGKADVTVVTCDAGKAGMAGCSTVELGRWRRGRGFRKILTEAAPDVVHIHACWNRAAATLFKECGSLHVPTVLTLDHGLDSWHAVRNCWLRKLPMWFMFQRGMLERAGAVHFVTAQECDRFMRLGRHPRLKAVESLNARTAVIGAFNITGGVTVEDMADGLLALYGKVADSAPFFRMTSDERLAEDRLLAISLEGGLGRGVSGGDKALLESLGVKSWRRILIHAYDEGVYDCIRDAIGRSCAESPCVDVENIDRFDMNAANGAGGRAVSESRAALRLKSDAALPDFECGLCVMLCTLILKVRRACARRSDFVRLYKMLRFNEYDEALVNVKMRSLGLGGDSARMLQILKERYGLGEGFMFADPLDDKGTAELRKKLFKSGIQ